MKRKKEFKSSLKKPLSVSDSRFGLRKLYLNDREKPSIATYRTPVKGVNGESQN